MLHPRTTNRQMSHNEQKSQYMFTMLLLQTLTCVTSKSECVQINAFASQTLVAPMLRPLQMTARAMAEIHSGRSDRKLKSIHKNINRFMSQMLVIIGYMIILSNALITVFTLVHHYCVVCCLQIMYSIPIVSLSGWLTVYD